MLIVDVEKIMEAANIKTLHKFDIFNMWHGRRSIYFSSKIHMCVFITNTSAVFTFSNVMVEIADYMAHHGDVNHSDADANCSQRNYAALNRYKIF